MASLKEWKAVAAAHQGTTLALAKFISELKPEHIPDSTRAIVAQAFVDAIWCGLYGLLTPWAKIIHGFALEQGGPQESSVWAGEGRKVSAMNAALALGTALHSFEVDDHNGGGKVHPGAAIIPAALALGERDGISGEKLLACSDGREPDGRDAVRLRLPAHDCAECADEPVLQHCRGDAG